MKNDDLKDPKDPKIDAPEGDGCGASEKHRKDKRWKRKERLIRASSARVTEVATALLKTFRGLDLLSKRDRERIVVAFRRVICPPKKAGRPQSERITRAWHDWKEGIRRVELYRRNIPKYDSLSDAERAVEMRKLMSAIRKRERRAEGESSRSPATSS